MASYNRVILMGNLTRDVELRAVGTSQVANFSLAINDRKKVDGEWVDDPVFVNCAAWGKTAGVLEQYAKKGDPIQIEGRLQMNQWEKDGQKRSELRVLVDRLQLVKSKGTSQPKPQATEHDTTEYDIDSVVPF